MKQEQGHLIAFIRSDRCHAIVEQMLISGSNFFLYVYAARALPKDEWGELSFSFATLLVLQGFQRAFVTVPMVTSGDDGGVFLDNLSFWARVQGWVTVTTLGLLLCFYGLASCWLDTWVAESILLSIILVIPLYYMEFARRVVIMAFTMLRLVTMALIYAVTILLIGAMGWWLGYDQHPWFFVLVITLSAFISSLSARTKLLPILDASRKGSWDVQSLWRFGRWAAASSLAYTGYNFSIQAILAAIAGPSALGIFAATRNLTQPINVLIQAIDSIDKPRAGRAYIQQNMRGLWDVTRQSWLWLIALALPYLVLIFLLSESVLIMIYGNKYSNAVTEVQFWCGVMIVMIVVQPLETGLYVIRRPDGLFYGRAISAGLVLMLTPWLITNWSVNGALFSLILGWGVAGIIASWQLVRGPNVR